MKCKQKLVTNYTRMCRVEGVMCDDNGREGKNNFSVKPTKEKNVKNWNESWQWIVPICSVVFLHFKNWNKIYCVLKVNLRWIMITMMFINIYENVW